MKALIHYFFYGTAKTIARHLLPAKVKYIEISLLLFVHERKFYTLLTAAICWAFWTTRNKVIFENYVVKSTMVIIENLFYFVLGRAIWTG
jgi:hypothetical protein